MADLKTVSEELAEIDKALTAILLGGQSYTIGSRKLTRADYSALVARKTELQAELAAEDSSSLISDTYVSVFEGR
ncbi:MAG: peptidylprolyl isomerase [Clostridiales bacterium]|nr:peptidylprolyl isomerase [Clostridiales bacterium]